MRPIISNDGVRILAKPDYFTLERTQISSAVVAGSTTLPVINSSGMAAKDFILIGDPGQNRSEIVKITSVTGNNITIPSLTFAYDIKSSVNKMGYNLINFYKGSTLISSATIRADFYTAISETCVADNDYSISFYNSETTKETPKGEVVIFDERLLCSESDLIQYESNIFEYAARWSIIDKIDIASREIYNLFKKQDVDVSDLDNRELLRPVVALLALYYYYNSKILAQDDVPSLKSEKYLTMYKSKLDDVTSIINVTDDSVEVHGGQTEAVR